MNNPIETASSQLAPVPLRIDIVSDVVCPWCIIGYRQLQRALEQMAGSFEVEIHWQPFELNPEMPDEGQEIREHLAQKYGSTAEQSRGVRSRLTELGESLGFKFDYYDGMRMYNTFQAHQLLYWAAQKHLQTELKMALFEAFFSHRQNISDPAVLVQIAGSVGLDAAEAQRVLASACYAEELRAEQARWLDRDVHAVPMFFFNHGFPVPGAQDASTFVKVLTRLAKKTAEEN